MSKLYSHRSWIGIAICTAILALLPILNLAFPEGHALHVSSYAIALIGKFMCYALAALALDLVWGYTGILSLGHGVFFALGGYAHGMYLMRAIGHDGVYQSDLPDFMVFLDWKTYPWYWSMTDNYWYCLALVVLVPGVLAFVFGFFAFRSRIKGVYFSIITQAMTFAFMLLFFRNNTGFGGNNGFTDFKRILGYSVSAPSTRAVLYLITGAFLLGALAAVPLDRRLQIGPGAAGGARLGIAPDVHRLQPVGIQAVRVDPVGGIVRHCRRFVCAAGRHHQSVRNVAGKFHRNGGLGGSGRARHADRTDPRRVYREWFEKLVHRRFPRLVAVCTGRNLHPGHPGDAGWPARLGSAHQGPQTKQGDAMSSVLQPGQMLDAKPGEAPTSYARIKPEGVDTLHGAILYLEEITVSFDGFKALNQLNWIYRSANCVASSAPTAPARPR